ncbi:MAG: phytanoyl-CoA dioxygenase family protein [Acidimicrobiia bacterium]
MTAKQLVAEKHIADFERDGVICLRSVIDDRWLEVVAEAIDRDIASPGPFFHGYDVDGSGRFHGNLRTWENDEGFRSYCMESPLPSMAQQIMRTTRVNLFYDQLFVKDADTQSPTRWHNDQPYWPVRGRQVISFWLALDHTDLSNGGLEFVGGSHRWERWFQPEPFGPTNTIGYDKNPDYEKMVDIDAERSRHEILSWDLEPGDVLAFSAMTVHGAPPNMHPSRRRRGYTVRYTGDDAVYYSAAGMSQPLLTDTLTSGDPIGGDRFPQVIPR